MTYNLEEQVRWEKAKAVIKSCVTKQQLMNSKKYLNLTFAALSDRDSKGDLEPTMQQAFLYENLMQIIEEKLSL